jgi:hypothetical protein
MHKIFETNSAFPLDSLVLTTPIFSWTHNNDDDEDHQRDGDDDDDEDNEKVKSKICWS